MTEHVEMCHWYYTAKGRPLCWKGCRASLKCHTVSDCRFYQPSSDAFDYSRAPDKPPAMRVPPKPGLCKNCESTRFWLRTRGGPEWLCARCHPDPKEAA